MENQFVETLKSGGIGVLLTDTLYGLVGQALNKKSVEKIYNIKGRQSTKPLIILISSLKEISLFGIPIDKEIQKTLNAFWPGPVSVILPCPLKEFEYLHRGTESLAFRLPSKKSLVEIIKKTGPLVAPSANPEGLSPAKNITEAKKYFGPQVDFYLSSGKPKASASTIVKIHKGKVEIVRGVVSLSEIKK